MPDSGIAIWVKEHPAPALLATAGIGVLLFVMLPKGGTTVNPPGVPTGIDQNDYATTDELTRLQEWIASHYAQTGDLPPAPPPGPIPPIGPRPAPGGGFLPGEPGGGGGGSGGHGGDNEPGGGGPLPGEPGGGDPNHDLFRLPTLPGWGSFSKGL